jgi:hypothetical protein
MNDGGSLGIDALMHDRVCFIFVHPSPGPGKDDKRAADDSRRRSVLFCEKMAPGPAPSDVLKLPHLFPVTDRLPNVVIASSGIFTVSTPA